MMKTKFNATNKLPLWIAIWCVIFVAAGALALVFGFNSNFTVFSHASTDVDYKTATVSYDLSMQVVGEGEEQSKYIAELTKICDETFKANKIDAQHNVYSTELGGSLEYRIADVKVSDDALNTVWSQIEAKIAQSAVLTVADGAISDFDFEINTCYVQPAYDFVWRAAIVGGVAIAVACVYVLVRYSVSMGLATLIAGVGDVATVVGLTVICRLPVTSTFAVMAVFAALYSILLSLVSFSDYREQLKDEKYKTMDVKEAMQEVSTSSTKTVLLLTGAVVVIAAIFAVSFVFIGNAPIVATSISVIVTAIASAYSTLCVKPALVTAFKLKGKKMKDKRLEKQRLAQKEAA